MNERLAYFCDRAAPTSHLYTWSGEDTSAECLYQVYCRAALDDPWPLGDGDAVDLDALRQRIAAAGGGLVARTERTRDRTELHLERVPGTGYEPATELLLLSPDRDPERLPLGGEAIALKPGAFVLLPATAEDQTHLHGLLEHLYRLPGDYRALLLNVLRRPGIEAAMRRLERSLERLQGQLPLTATDARTEPAPAPRIGGPWPWVATGLLVLNLAAVLGSAVWLKEPAKTPDCQPEAVVRAIPDPLLWPRSLGVPEGEPPPSHVVAIPPWQSSLIPGAIDQLPAPPSNPSTGTPETPGGGK